MLLANFGRHHVSMCGKLLRIVVDLVDHISGPQKRLLLDTPDTRRINERVV